MRHTSPRSARALIGAASAVLLASAITLTPRAAHAQASYFYQVTSTGIVDELTVESISSPSSQYQIKHLNAGDNANAASYDPTTNRLYYVRNVSGGTLAQLWYLQLDSTGAVTSEVFARNLPSTISVSAGADYYNGRIWLSNDTNVLYGFNTSNLAAAPITMTLPTSPGNNGTDFDLGDLTFDDANHILYIAGGHGSQANSFVYKYDVSNVAAPVLLAHNDYSSTTSDPFLNGVIFNQDTSTLYGYYAGTSDLYTLDQTALTISSTVGSNTDLSQLGDLAGFTPFSPLADSTEAPEPSSVALLLAAAPLITGAAAIRRRKRLSL